MTTSSNLPHEKILITGATGAVGQEMLKQLSAKGQLDGVSVFALDSKKNHKLLASYASQIQIFWGDIRHKDQVRAACEGQDIVIHLAAIIPPLAHKNHELTTAVNQRGTENVVAAMEAVAPEAFLLYSSSVAIYGDRLKTPMIRISDPLPEVEHDHYAKTKIAAEACIKSSGLAWSILRLSAIMGVGNHKVSGIMFDVPLETPMEITTVRDTARAFVHAIDKTDSLKHKMFNLGGGAECRIFYKDFLEKSFEAFGMGKVNFPEYAFAKQNFHCGYYADGDELEEILHFRQDDMASYFVRFKAAVPAIQRMATIPFAGIVKRILLNYSKPYKAFKEKNTERINFYFGLTDL